MGKTYSTPQVAKMLGVHFLTIHRWIKSGAVTPKGIELSDGRMLWRWSETDVEKARKHKAEQKPGPKVKTKK